MVGAAPSMLHEIQGSLGMKSYVYTVERKIAAPPEAIFDVLADPAKHSLIDGSGMLQGAVDGSDVERLTLGSTFGMGMKMGMGMTMSMGMRTDTGMRTGMLME